MMLMTTEGTDALGDQDDEDDDDYDIVRIQVSEDEYWMLSEQAWEESKEAEAQGPERGNIGGGNSSSSKSTSNNTSSRSTSSGEGDGDLSEGHGVLPHAGRSAQEATRFGFSGRDDQPRPEHELENEREQGEDGAEEELHMDPVAEAALEHEDDERLLRESSSQGLDLGLDDSSAPPEDGGVMARLAPPAPAQATTHAAVASGAPRGTEPAYEAFNLRVVHERRRTGFEETKELKVFRGMKLAGRYEVHEVVGEAAFSTALRCVDVEHRGLQVCTKVIKNNKDFFDQSLDEIRLLKYLNTSGDADAKHFVRLYDYFYHKEHLVIVTELLDTNLYTAYKAEQPARQAAADARARGLPPPPRAPGAPPALYETSTVRDVARQLLEALEFVAELGVIHCDLKPENVLLVPRAKGESGPIRVKLIDFGSSCFSTDNLSSYIQSRFYRAPEVILGLRYDERIDIWSLGALLAELYMGRVLFECDTHPVLLAKIVAALGPFPRHMVADGRFGSKWLLGGTIYERSAEGTGGAELLYPKKRSLWGKLGQPHDVGFVEFISRLLTKDPQQRPKAKDALRHPWLAATRT